MKSLIGVVMVAVFGVCVNAQQAPEPVSDNAPSTRLAETSTDSWLQKIVTRDGQVYRNCRLIKVEPNGLLIEHSPREGALGLAKVRFAVLPPEIQKQFNYEPTEAAQFDSLQQKSNDNWARQVEEQKKAMARVAEESEKQALALRLEEERVRLENERLAAQRDHEVKLIREQAYGDKEAAKWSYWNYSDFFVSHGRHDFDDPDLVPRKPARAVPVSSVQFTAKNPKPAPANKHHKGK